MTDEKILYEESEDSPFRFRDRMERYAVIERVDHYPGDPSAPPEDVTRTVLRIHFRSPENEPDHLDIEIGQWLAVHLAPAVVAAIPRYFLESTERDVLDLFGRTVLRRVIAQAAAAGEEPF